MTEEEQIGKWYAVIVRLKRRKILYIAKIIHRHLMDPAGPVESLEMGFLIKYRSGDIINDTPQHLPDDIGLEKQYDLLTGPLKVEREGKGSS